MTSGTSTAKRTGSEMHPDNVGAQFTQLPMFMTGAEIKRGWSPPAGDRQTWYHDPVGQGDHPNNRPETDQEVWSRKGRENFDFDMGDGTFNEQTRRINPGMSRAMYMDMYEPKFDVQEPVRLQAPLRNGVTGDGEGGKPIIYDGTHRVAHYSAYHSHASDTRLLPVKFYENDDKYEEERDAGGTSWPNIYPQRGDRPGTWPHVEDWQKESTMPPEELERRAKIRERLG